MLEYTRISNVRVSLIFRKYCKRGFETGNWKQPALESFN
jgi:hypothetical protein